MPFVLGEFFAQTHACMHLLCSQASRKASRCVKGQAASGQGLQYLKSTQPATAADCASSALAEREAHSWHPALSSEPWDSRCCRGAFDFVRELQRQHPAAVGAAAWYRIPFLVDAIAPSVEQIDAAYFVLEDMHSKVRRVCKGAASQSQFDSLTVERSEPCESSNSTPPT